MAFDFCPISAPKLAIVFCYSRQHIHFNDCLSTAFNIASYSFLEKFLSVNLLWRCLTWVKKLGCFGFFNISKYNATKWQHAVYGKMIHIYWISSTDAWTWGQRGQEETYTPKYPWIDELHPNDLGLCQINYTFIYIYVINIFFPHLKLPVLMKCISYKKHVVGVLMKFISYKKDVVGQFVQPTALCFIKFDSLGLSVKGA